MRKLIATIVGLSAGVALACIGMPVVDRSLNMTPVVGHSTLRVSATSQVPSPSTTGAFRIACDPSHMSNDDPIVYPGVVGAAHHHTFFGNVSINANTTNPASGGNSTCKGGIMNRSGYWIPSMIDTRTGKPLKGDGNVVYYKRGIQPYPVTTPPAGLRMIAGNHHAENEAEAGNHFFRCIPPTGPIYGIGKSIPACAVGHRVILEVYFPSCWDGVNLDSADHKSHMAYPTSSCPATHPNVLPIISFNVFWTVQAGDDTTKWRLASDNYDWASPGGYSAHGDWWNGWDQAFLQQIVTECVQANKECFAHLIGNGQQIY
jgi:hypothetical protein